MLDPVGITLDEVNSTYPSIFQMTGYDVLMDSDAMGKPKVITSFRSCVNAILFLLYLKPGQYPSIPELGINVGQYLYSYADDKSIAMEIKQKLIDQCNAIKIVGVTIDCFIEEAQDNKSALIITVTGTEILTYGEKSNKCIIGISPDKLDRLQYRVRTI